MLTRRRALAAIALPAATAKAAPAGEFGERVLRFHRLWDKFLRTYFGCPVWAKEVRECDLQRGLLDYPEFLKAAKAGRELFELEKK